MLASEIETQSHDNTCELGGMVTDRLSTPAQFFGLFLLSFLFLTALAAAQTPSAPLTGGVVDVSGATLPGAAVTVATGNSAGRTVFTNASGVFTVANLAPGTYRVTVELAGFRPAARDAVTVPLEAGALEVVMEIA